MATPNKLMNIHCPQCNCVVVMQAGIKECSACHATIGADVWMVTPSPLSKEDFEARRNKHS